MVEEDPPYIFFRYKWMASSSRVMAMPLKNGNYIITFPTERLNYRITGTNWEIKKYSEYKFKILPSKGKPKIPVELKITHSRKEKRDYYYFKIPKKAIKIKFRMITLTGLKKNVFGLMLNKGFLF